MSVIVILGTWQVLKESWRFTAKKKKQHKETKNKKQTPSPPPKKNKKTPTTWGEKLEN